MLITFLYYIYFITIHTYSFNKIKCLLHLKTLQLKYKNNYVYDTVYLIFINTTFLLISYTKKCDKKL